MTHGLRDTLREGDKATPDTGGEPLRGEHSLTVFKALGLTPHMAIRDTDKRFVVLRVFICLFVFLS